MEPTTDPMMQRSLQRFLQARPRIRALAIIAIIGMLALIPRCGGSDDDESETATNETTPTEVAETPEPDETPEPEVTEPDETPEPEVTEPDETPEPEVTEPDESSVVDSEACIDILAARIEDAIGTDPDPWVEQWWNDLAQLTRRDISAWLYHQTSVAMTRDEFTPLDDACIPKCPYLANDLIVDVSDASGIEIASDRILKALLEVLPERVAGFQEGEHPAPEILIEGRFENLADGLRTRLNVEAIDNAALDGADLVRIELLGALAVQGSQALDPLEMARALQELDIAASPNYVVSPHQGRIMFPGGLPVPAAIGFWEQAWNTGSYVDQDAPTIHVIDTGFIDDLTFGTEASTTYSTRDEDRLILGDQGSKLIHGHGTFAAAMVRSFNPNANLRQWRVQPDGESGQWTDSDLLEAAHRVWTDHQKSGDEVLITNLSLGGVACSGTGDSVAPVLQLRALSRYLLNGENTVVTAAAGRATLDPAGLKVYPAAFTDAEIRADQPNGYELGTLIAVGALNEADDVATYSQSAVWVDTYRAGCHCGPYPVVANSLVPFGPQTELGPVVRWCGTSFAAPIVAAEISYRLSQGEVLADVVADIVADIVVP